MKQFLNAATEVYHRVRQQALAKRPAGDAGGEVVLSIATPQGMVRVSLDHRHASARAAYWRRHEDHIEYAFPEGVSGYLVENGNTTSFSNAQQTASITLEPCAPMTLSAAAGTVLGDLPGIAYLFMLDADGAPRARARVSLDGQPHHAVLEAPADAGRAALAVRLAGTGLLRTDGLALAAGRPQPAPAPETDDVAATAPHEPEERTPQPDLGPARIAYADRNWTVAAAYLQDLPQRNRTGDRLLMRSLVQLRRFAEAETLYASLDVKSRNDPEIALLRLNALGNLQQPAEIRRFLMEHALGKGLGGGFFAAAYPMAVRFTPDLRPLLLARVAAGDDSGRHFNPLLRCASDAFELGEIGSFVRILEQLHRRSSSTLDEAKLAILRAQIAFLRRDWTAQFEALNSALALFDLAPVQARRAAEPLTPGNVKCATEETHRGPLVSVLMTAYNCASTLEYAAKSILGQSYRDLELIIIDDASSDGTRAKLQKLAKSDPRVRPILLDANGGTYVAKNHGLAAAKGDYVTSQDSDDWAHPAKIATLVQALEEHPDQIGAAVSHLRCNRAKGIQARGYVRPDASSLMFRRAPVLETIGFYDSARAGADSEFAYRLERAFGRRSIQQLPHLLSLVLWSDTSLSGGGAFVIDDDAGVFSEARNAYRRAFCEWQEAAQELRLDFPLGKRPFPIPPAMQP